MNGALPNSRLEKMIQATLALAPSAPALEFEQSWHSWGELEQSARATGPLWVWVISPRDPAYDLVRHSERFKDLVRQAGLDVAWVTKPRR